MSDGITPALIALGGVFLSAFISYLVSVKTTRYNYIQYIAMYLCRILMKYSNTVDCALSSMAAISG